MITIHSGNTILAYCLPDLLAVSRVSGFEFDSGGIEILMQLFVVSSRESRAAQNPVGWRRERSVPGRLR